MDEGDLMFQMEHAAALRSSGPWTRLLELRVVTSGVGKTASLAVETKHNSVRVVIVGLRGDAFEYWNDRGESALELLIMALEVESLHPSVIQVAFANAALVPDSRPTFGTGHKGRHLPHRAARPVEDWCYATRRSTGGSLEVAAVAHVEGWSLAWRCSEPLPTYLRDARTFDSKAAAAAWALISAEWWSRTT